MRIADLPCSSDVCLKTISSIMLLHGASGADVDSVCSAAALRAIREFILSHPEVSVPYLARFYQNITQFNPNLAQFISK